MGNIRHSMLDLVGSTPMVELHRLAEQQGVEARLLAKLEFFNPAGSVKDRIAKHMIEQAEREGRLQPGGTVIEATSGNTGIGLAAVAAAKGYKAIIVMPDNLSAERISILKGYGAEVVLTPGELNMAGAGAKAEEILARTEGGFMTRQGGNAGNPQAHKETTGPEIWADTDGQVDIFVSAAGTGGTLAGVGAFLREKNPAIRLIAVEPAGSPLLSGGQPGPHRIQGIGGGIIAPVTRLDLMDEIITVTDEAAFAEARNLARTEGLSVGISAGAAIWAALQIARRPRSRGKTIVVIIPDSGERYLSSGLL